MAEQVNPTHSNQIFAALREEIIRGTLAPGEKLRQDHIAARFATSHVPVREALLRLVATGLATSEPRRGVRIAPLDPQELGDVVEMRTALETMALKHAMAKMKASHLKGIEQAMLACDRATSAMEQDRWNRAFHYGLVAACAMPRLLETIEHLQLISARHFNVNWKDSWKQTVDRDHHLIFQLVKQGETVAAQAALARHLQKIR
ncbi:GntR family transcriptional regulator [Polycladidibacter hongkongensis]|uniref:GntR family transcriptional regulator n=1 Tax=Polycladidibacter hongkongensis TaxID=1647556 RepID=UPI000831624E|nr:GntR family transcriptional regulator [Pseudovibrio hongkongensis]